MSDADFGILASAGAELLDDIAGDWYRLVDLDTFDMMSTEFCVLGQVFGRYLNGLDECAEAIGERFTGNRSNQRKYGFDLSEDEYYHSDFGDFMWKLQAAWVEEIEARRDAM